LTFLQKKKEYTEHEVDSTDSAPTNDEEIAVLAISANNPLINGE